MGASYGLRVIVISAGLTCPLACEVCVRQGEGRAGWVAWLSVQLVDIGLAHRHGRVDVLTSQQTGGLLPTAHGAL